LGKSEEIKANLTRFGKNQYLTSPKTFGLRTVMTASMNSKDFGTPPMQN